jgi:hypothetical protein
MSLINCPECNKQISDKAEACPFCINVEEIFKMVSPGTEIKVI